MSQTKHSVRVKLIHSISSREFVSCKLKTRLLNSKQAISHPKEWRKLFMTEIPLWEMYMYIFLIRTEFSIVTLSLLLANCTLARL